MKPDVIYREKLVSFWDIPRGARVLELGCGQGETTRALLRAVGARGFVHGIDSAGADYGAPETLGDARSELLAGRYGARLQMDFDTDIFSVKPQDGGYGYAVLSHCSWYFENAEELEKTLLKARELADTLCFAEWDLHLSDPAQLVHYRAVAAQAIAQSYTPSDMLNIRTLFTREDILDALAASGWRVTRTASLETGTPDGAWERNNALAVLPSMIEVMNAPEALKRYLRSELRAIEASDAKDAIALPSIAISAE
ncbi:MAG: hypothetical protein LBC28_02295 [Oscillospiraceae bacterium]|nr:hypothetical protein [Oscillospiraceae bacterium]